MSGDFLGDYHQQNFTFETLDTLFYGVFKRDSAKFVEIAYPEQFNLANGIAPIGEGKDGSYIFAPQWIGITTAKEKE
jgi:hypothetical protein